MYSVSFFMFWMTKSKPKPSLKDHYNLIYRTSTCAIVFGLCGTVYVQHKAVKKSCEEKQNKRSFNMDPACFTLPKVSYIYPLFTEQLTCNAEKHKIMAVPLEQKHTHKKRGKQREKNSGVSVFHGCQSWD